MEIRNVKLSKLIHYEKNTKKHDDTQINNVTESIRQFGFVQPIVIDRDNVIVIGHCRALAAQRMMEYEAYYCDVIIKRWEEFTGNKAVLLNG